MIRSANSGSRKLKRVMNEVHFGGSRWVLSVL